MVKKQWIDACKAKKRRVAERKFFFGSAADADSSSTTDDDADDDVIANASSDPDFVPKVRCQPRRFALMSAGSAEQRAAPRLWLLAAMLFLTTAGHMMGTRTMIYCRHPPSRAPSRPPSRPRPQHHRWLTATRSPPTPPSIPARP